MLGFEPVVDILDLNGRNAEGYTPLHLAARHGQAESVTLLLEGGASLNTMALDGTTPLVAAVRSGSSRCVQQLLMAGAAQGNVTGPGLLTEAMIAAVAGDFVILKLLIEAQDEAFESGRVHADQPGYLTSKSLHGDSLEDILQKCHNCSLEAAVTTLQQHQHAVEFDPRRDIPLSSDAQTTNDHSQHFFSEDAASVDLEANAAYAAFSQAAADARQQFRRGVEQERELLRSNPAGNVDEYLKRSVMEKVFAVFDRHALAAAIEFFIGAAGNGDVGNESDSSGDGMWAHNAPGLLSHGYTRRRLGRYAADMVQVQWYRFRSHELRAWGPVGSMLSHGGADALFYSKSYELQPLPGASGPRPERDAYQRNWFRLWYLNWRRRSHWLHHHLLHCNEASFLYRAYLSIKSDTQQTTETIVQSKHTESVRQVLSKYPYPLPLDASNTHGQRALGQLLDEHKTSQTDRFIAMLSEDYEEPYVDAMLDVYQRIVGIFAASGRTGFRFDSRALWAAVESNDFAAILCQGVRCHSSAIDMNCLGGDPRDDITLLMRACELGHTECVRALAQCGADLNIRRSQYFADDSVQRDQSGETALMIAARCGHAKTVWALLQHNPAVDLIVIPHQLDSATPRPGTKSSVGSKGSHNTAETYSSLVVDASLLTLPPLAPLAVRESSSTSSKFQNKEEEFTRIEHGKSALFLAAEANHAHTVRAIVADDGRAVRYAVLQQTAESLREHLAQLEQEAADFRNDLALRALAGGIIKRLDKEGWKAFRARQWLEARGCNADGRLPQVKAKMASKIISDCVYHPTLAAGSPHYVLVHLMNVDQCMALHAHLESLGSTQTLDAGADETFHENLNSDPEAHQSHHHAHDGRMLPAGWESHVDDDGYEYFYHSASDTSSWEFPVEPVQDSSEVKSGTSTEGVPGSDEHGGNSMIDLDVQDSSDEDTMKAKYQAQQIEAVKKDLDQIDAALALLRAEIVDVHTAVLHPMNLRGGGLGGGEFLPAHHLEELHQCYFNRRSGRSTLNLKTEEFQVTLSPSVPQDASRRRAVAPPKYACRTSPLIRAAWLGHDAVVKELLSAHEVPNTDCFHGLEGIDALQVDSLGLCMCA